MVEEVGMKRTFMYCSLANNAREGGWRSNNPCIKSRVERMRRSFWPSFRKLARMLIAIGA